MTTYPVSIFTQYQFTAGQKIRIADGKRAGDWEVVGQSETTVTLRCPISGKEFEWQRFCYHVEEKTGEAWPSPKHD